jgi:cytochrome c-type biogenesis protein CcmE
MNAPTDVTPPDESAASSLAASSVVVATRRKSPVRVWVALGAIVVALGFVLANGLGEATMFFRSADQAVAQRDKLGTDRFTIEGLVLEGSVRKLDGSVAFTIENNGVQVNVVHKGIPPELFRENLPVVLEGRFSSKTGAALFQSDVMMVKHTAEYVSKNPDRVKDYVKK